MKKNALFLLFFVSTVIFLCCSALAQDNEEKKPIRGMDSAYRIGSGDILSVVTWKEPGLSLEIVLVRSDGKITFPLLYDIQAAGSTPYELAKTIEKGLKKFVENPYVTVHVQNPLSKKFYILGEVMATGEYPLVKPLTVLQAFAIAGGFTEWASKKEIILLRSENGKDEIYRVNYKKIVNGEDLGQNIFLQPNDTIIVP